MTAEDQESGSPSSTSTDGSKAEAAPATPEARIAALETEKGELKDRMLRIAAEFENWKKRARREQEEAETRMRDAVLKDMLEVMDNLERATNAWQQGASQPDGQSVVQGVNLVQRMFQSKLERYNIHPLDAKGKPFDPRLHDAISQVPSADVAPGTIISELQKGYRAGERLLRPASVVVAIAPPAPNGQSGSSGASGDGSGAGKG